MILVQIAGIYRYAQVAAAQFIRDEKADILQTAGIIAAVSVAIIALIAIGAMAAGAIQNASGWFQ